MLRRASSCRGGILFCCLSSLSLSLCAVSVMFAPWGGVIQNKGSSLFVVRTVRRKKKIIQIRGGAFRSLLFPHRRPQGSRPLAPRGVRRRRRTERRRAKASTVSGRRTPQGRGHAFSPACLLFSRYERERIFPSVIFPLSAPLKKRKIRVNFFFSEELGGNGEEGRKVMGVLYDTHNSPS